MGKTESYKFSLVLDQIERFKRQQEVILLFSNYGVVHIAVSMLAFNLMLAPASGASYWKDIQFFVVCGLSDIA